jgi:uncharacterized glyoxalase superfamily protein PhnB/predicted kinase
METNRELVPLLVVRDAHRALDFYVRTMGANIVALYEHGKERHVSHADLELAGATFALTEEARTWNSDAPPSLGGSPVVLQWQVENAEATVVAMLHAGASVVFPLGEFLGERMARVRDPFGHIWLVRQRLETLSTQQIQAQRDALFARFAASIKSPWTPPATHAEEDTSLRESRARVQLVVGPVGAGKSTFARELARECSAVRFALDEWMAELFSPDRPEHGIFEWYVERAARSVERIWAVARQVVETGTSVVLELGLLRREERERFYGRLDGAGFGWTIHVVDGARDVRRERVRERNRTKGVTFSMVVPNDVFELASDLWEPPSGSECEGRDVRFVGSADIVREKLE